MKDFFDVKYHKTTYLNEIMAGVSMFFSVAYILVVNPSILAQCGMNAGNVFLATAITAAISTFFMAIYGKAPVVLAPGLSLNSLFVWYTMSYFGGDYSVTLLATYLSGVVVIMLVLSGVYRKIDSMIPDLIKYAILAGDGLALARVGLDNAGFFQDPFRLETLYILFGILVIAFLRRKKVRGGILIGMVSTALLGYLVSALVFHRGFGASVSAVFTQSSTTVIDSESFFADCFRFPSLHRFISDPGLFLQLLGVTLSISIYHFTDAMGTTSSLFAYLDQKGRRLPNAYKTKSMYVNGMAGMISGLFGTSSCTTYAESIVGISEGACTGVASATVAILFLISGFFFPFVGSIASYITAAPLVVVGILSFILLKYTTGMDLFERILMLGIALYIGFTFQIAIGFGVGMVVYYLYHRICKRSAKGA